ncbi:sugar-phosphate nucleotidyltransferase [Bacillus sp. UMB0893]|nr:sugar-phosphate nucleotidyltransferase [Bacillus sp. UMB0893]
MKDFIITDKEMKHVKAVILAGGEGRRLRPLTNHCPKPMVPILNKPVMEYGIELLKKHGIHEIIMTVHYLSSTIRSYFGDGSKWGVRITYSEEGMPLGTAGSVKLAEHMLTEPFLVISGDIITDFDLRAGIEHHAAHSAAVTIFTKPLDFPIEYGVLLSSNKKMKKMFEKPNWSDLSQHSINTGIYILNPAVFTYLEGFTYYDFSTDVFPAILSHNEKISLYEAVGYWSDVGTIANYRQTQFDMLDHKVNLPTKGKEIAKGIWMEDGVTIQDDVTLRGPIYLSGNTIIHEGAIVGPNTVLSEAVTIQEGSKITHSILWENSDVGKSCTLGGMIGHCKIQAHSTLADLNHEAVSTWREYMNKDH